jgi:hypothetical protein
MVTHIQTHTLVSPTESPQGATGWQPLITNSNQKWQASLVFAIPPWWVHCQHHRTNTQINKKEGSKKKKLTQMTRSQTEAKCKSSRVSKAWSLKKWATTQHNQARMASPQEKTKMGSTPLARNQIQIGAKDRAIELKATLVPLERGRWLNTTSRNSPNKENSPWRQIALKNYTYLIEKFADVCVGENVPLELNSPPCW